MRTSKTQSATLALTVTAICLGILGWAQERESVDPRNIEKLYERSGYSPYAGRAYPTQVFWGDTHLHTSISLDARAFGTQLGHEDAYRFARGEEVIASGGERAQLSRPLDFLVVADHAEAYGTMNEIAKGNPMLMTDPVVKRWHNMLREGGDAGYRAALEVIQALSANEIPEVMKSPKLARVLWEEAVSVAEEYNEPGRFTALIGYEWTSNNSGNNLHRVVIFRDGADKVLQTIPFSALNSEDPEHLWKFLDSYEEKTGGSVLAIAHNGNLSNGRMFGPVGFTGRPLTRQYVETRRRWEPLYEVTQIKGDGETHPFLSPNDEFADYETWDAGNLNLSEDKKPEMLQYEYARQALKIGLQLEQEYGTNPFKFGMVGSTDSHTSLATAAEENFFGKHTGKEPSAHRWMSPIAEFNGKVVMGWEQAASGYAAVWATENTREALFDAMQRKEVYATTGSRIIVRFFGGWDFTEEDTLTRTPAAAGYAKGVPMGGDLPEAPRGKSPTFLVAARRDPYGGNLDRVQVVKGWMDVAGELHEKVYDVVWSDSRQPGPDGKLPPVGETVDVANAVWLNSTGASELIDVWEDPDFNRQLRAFYYARVIEVPTPRWTAYDAKRFRVKMTRDVPMTTQERAYTSPIWYTPE